MARHTKARDADVLLSAAEDHIARIVRDDGRGSTEAEVAGRRSPGSLGTCEHALLLGGGVMIQAQPGQSATAMLEVPRFRWDRGGAPARARR